MNETEAMELAFTRAKTPYKLAQQIGISKQAAYKWRKRGRIGWGCVIAVEKVTGVSRYLLRPDIYHGEQNELTGNADAQAQ